MLTFGIFSDLHNSKGDFDNLMNNIFELSQNGEKLDALIGVGDVVYHPAPDSVPSKDSYAMINANEKFAKMKASNRLVFAMGNHEFPLHCKDKEKCDLAKRVFTEETGLTPEKVTVIEGYHFITAGPNTYENDLSAEQERFIKESVTEALKADPVKPVFLFIHQPVDNTLYGSEPYDYYSEELEEFLKHEPRLVVFSGHMHMPSSDPQSIYQIPGGTTFVYTSSIMGGNGAKTPYSSERHRIWPSQAIMMNVDTDTNSVIIKRFYVSSSTPRYLEGGDWVLDIPAMIEESKKDAPDTRIYKYTNARRELSKAPYFEDGAKLTVKGICETGAILMIPTPKQGAEGEDSAVAYYIVELYNQTENKLEQRKTVLTDYFLENKQELYKYNFSKLSPETEWLVKVTPVTPWYVEGLNSITASFTTLAPKFDDAEFDEECAVRYNIVERAQFNGDRTSYGTFVMIASNWVTEFTFTEDVSTAGKYRVFLSTSSRGYAGVEVTLYDSDNNVIAKGDNITCTGGYTEFKDIPYFDVDIPKTGTYTFSFVKPVGEETISIKELVLKRHKEI